MGKKLRLKLQNAQNKLITYILMYDSRHHLECEDFVKVKYLNVEKRVYYPTINMMYNIYHGDALSYMCNMVHVDHNHATTNRSLLLFHKLKPMFQNRSNSITKNGTTSHVILETQ